MDKSDCPSPGSVVVVARMECFYFGLTNNNGACNLNSRAIACILTFCSGVSETMDKIFPNSRKMFEFYATKSSLFWLKAMHVMENLSDMLNLLNLWRFDALFGCGRVNSGVDACSRKR